MDGKVRIEDLRIERTKLTREDFARLLGKSVHTVYNYEKERTGKDVIQLIIDMCRILNCRVDELISSNENSELETDSKLANPNRASGLNSCASIRDWWIRIDNLTNVLGEKEIENIIEVLKSKRASTSEFEIYEVFLEDEALEKHVQKIIEEYEQDQKSRIEVDLLSEEVINLDRLSKDPIRCACIFAYLKTKDNGFLVNLSSAIKRIVRNHS